VTDPTRPSADHSTEPTDAGRGGRHVIVGIDLGTTNSLVALTPGPDDARFADTSPRVLFPAGEDPIIQSAVLYRPDGTTVVGSAALAAAGTYPGATITSVKRLMGRSMGDAAGATRSSRANTTQPASACPTDGSSARPKSAPTFSRRSSVEPNK